MPARREEEQTMIACGRCKTENLEGSQYCDECGAPLKPNVQSGAAGFSASPGIDSNGRKGASGNLQQAEFVTHPPAQAVRVPSSRSVSKPHAWLVIERGRSAGKQFMLSEVESQIGRWDADGGVFPDIDLDADDPEAKISRRHARILLNSGEYFLEDLGSTNGTFVNRGRRLPPGQPQPLREGDEIIVGKTFLRFHIFK
jgi:pSer/pThr/pTyr-binding forkhead associated (FHA) protein